MTNWIEVSRDAPPRNRVLLAYCPEWCDGGYSVVKWNGRCFEDESHGDDIHPYVIKWALFMEAD